MDTLVLAYPKKLIFINSVWTLNRVNLPGAMIQGDRWQEWVQRIHAVGTPWRWGYITILKFIHLKLGFVRWGLKRGQSTQTASTFVTYRADTGLTGTVEVTVAEDLVRVWLFSLEVPPLGPFVLVSNSASVFERGFNMIGDGMPGITVLNKGEPQSITYIQ